MIVTVVWIKIWSAICGRTPAMTSSSIFLVAGANESLLVQTTQSATTTEKSSHDTSEPGPRIALLTPYSGGNLGDAAIQDAMIANLRQRMPSSQFSGITLNSNNFINNHGTTAFPLLADDMVVSRGGRQVSANISPASSQTMLAPGNQGLKHPGNPLKRVLRTVPGLVPLLKKVRARLAVLSREIHHSVEGYHFIRKHDLLVISGGGQLDDEWGGTWVHPYALCKWVMLARLAGVRCAVVSVGAGKITSPTSRMFISLALRLSAYRSYRETKTKAIAAGLLRRTASDLIVPDVAFSMPESELPAVAPSIRTLVRGRTVIALSPIAFAKPVNWPTPDRAVYDRYVQQLGRVLSGLSRQGYFVMVVCSSLGDDESVIPDLLEHLGEDVRANLEGQIHFPTVKSWRDFIAHVREADFLIGSRLHTTILGFVARTPAIAISFDPKVDWVMEDLQMTDYLLQIRDFKAEDVFGALGRLQAHKHAVVQQLICYRQGVLSMCTRQYETLAALALAHQRARN